MRCPYCRFRVPHKDWDMLMEHIEKRRPREYRRRCVKHLDDGQAEIADEEHESSPISEWRQSGECSDLVYG